MRDLSKNQLEESKLATGRWLTRLFQHVASTAAEGLSLLQSKVEKLREFAAQVHLGQAEYGKIMQNRTPKQHKPAHSG